MSDLSRSYGLLLRAYPRWYRRERGLEILTTLLDAAAPGQRRPTAREIIHVIVSGVRFRFRPPRGLGFRLIAIMAASSVALVGAASGTMLSSYPGPPSDDQAIAVFETAFGHRPTNIPGPPIQCAGWGCPNDRAPGDAVVAFDAQLDGADHVVVWNDDRSTDPASAITQAHDRLAAAGWQVEPITRQEDTWTCEECDPAKIWYFFSASKGGTAVAVTGHFDRDTAANPDVSMSVSKALRLDAVALLVLGALGGLLIGWLATVWALHRLRRHSYPIPRLAFLISLPFLALGALAVLMATYFAVVVVIVTGHHSADKLMIPAWFLSMLPPVPYIMAFSAVVTLVLAALPIGVGRRPHGLHIAR